MKAQTVPMPGRRLTLLLGAMTAWPFVFGVVMLIVETAGLIPQGSAAPPPLFVLLLALLYLTPPLMLGLLVYYLAYLFTRARLPQDRRLVWAVALVAGHVLAMPVFWWRHVCSPRQVAPLPAATRFCLLAFGPLLLTLVLPLGYLVPMAFGVTGAALLGSGSPSSAGVLQAWVWVLGPGLTFVAIVVAGRWCHAAFERLRTRGAAWSWLWFAFTLMLVPVGWFATVCLRGLVPSDGPPNTLPELTRLALFVPLLAQPGVILWLYLVARWWHRGARHDPRDAPKTADDRAGSASRPAPLPAGDTGTPPRPGACPGHPHGPG